MRCAVCEKESNNRRVCPYCFTPYPVEGPSAKRASAARGSTGTRSSTGASPAGGAGSAGGSAGSSAGGSASDAANDALAGITAAAARAWAKFRAQTPLVQFSAAGIALVLVLWWATREEPQFEAGVVPSDIIATPMQREEAVALIKHTRGTAIVDIQQDEVFVTYQPQAFPVREDGQLALAQQFARADEIVEGRKRRIFFYNPNGKQFAQADGVRGVILVK